MDEHARVPGAPMTGVQARLLRALVGRRLGGVPRGIEVMWHHPAVLKDMARLGGRTERWDRLDRDLATYAAMATAARIGCRFCLDLNYWKAHHDGLDADKACEVPRWRESTVFSPLERRVMAYAEAMCATPPTVTDEMTADLLADLGAPGLVELTARIGYADMAARANVALGVPAHGLAEACGLRPLARPLARRPDGAGLS